jgi:hypothetical protein
MVSMLASSMVDGRSNQTIKIGIYCFSAKQAVQRLVGSESG